jgi:hypothetical protein
VNARSLLSHNIAVISIGSTLAIEAALAGKPVGVIGQVHFADMPGIRSLSSPRELDRVLGAPGATREQIEEWYGRFLDMCCFEGNIMKGRTSAINLNQLLSRASARAVFSAEHWPNRSSCL